MIPSSARAWSVAVSKVAVRRCCLSFSRAAHSHAKWDAYWSTDDSTPIFSQKNKLKTARATVKGNGTTASGVPVGLAAHLVCKCCNVQVTDEKTFIQHIMGKPHQRKSGGLQFCGLLPNLQALSQARLDHHKATSILILLGMNVAAAFELDALGPGTF
jgi:hypothetical protein